MTFSLFKSCTALVEVHRKIRDFITETHQRYYQLRDQMATLTVPHIEYFNYQDKISIQRCTTNYNAHRTVPEILTYIEEALVKYFWILTEDCLTIHFTEGQERVHIYKNNDIAIIMDSSYDMPVLLDRIYEWVENLCDLDTIEVNNFATVFVSGSSYSVYPKYYRYEHNPRQQAYETLYVNSTCPIDLCYKDDQSFYRFLQHLEYLCTYYLGAEQKFSLYYGGKNIVIRNENGNVYRSNRSKKLAEKLHEIYGVYDPKICNFNHLRTCDVMRTPAVLTYYQNLFGPIE